MFFYKLYFVCFNSGEIATNTYATNAKLQLLYLGSNTKSKTKLNSDKMVKIGVNDSNGPEDDKIKVGYNETRTSQVLFVRNFFVFGKILIIKLFIYFRI